MLGLPRNSCSLTVWRMINTSLRQFAGLASSQTVASCGEDTVKDFRVLNIASKLGIKAEEVLECVKASPRLLAYSPSQWQRCFAELEAQGFPKNEHLKMVTLNPAIISVVERQELSDIIETWRMCKMGHYNILKLLASCPQLFSLKIGELEQRLPMLKSLTKSNEKHLMRLLLGSPTVMFENWKDVLAKVDYVKNVMDLDTEKENISKTYLFSKDLSELKVRYMFLKRAGIYVNPPKVKKGTKIEQMQQPWSKNPRLFEIIDTSDEVFINKVAKGLSIEELKVFRELYIKELEKEESDLEEDESDDDLN